MIAIDVAQQMPALAGFFGNVSSSRLSRRTVYVSHICSLSHSRFDVHDVRHRDRVNPRLFGGRDDREEPRDIGHAHAVIELESRDLGEYHRGGLVDRLDGRLALDLPDAVAQVHLPRFPPW